MKSQVEENQRMNGGSMSTLPLVENIQSKDERLVKRSSILPNLVSCDIISDDQSIIGSRTLSGDSQCLENYPFLSMVGQQPLNNTILGRERAVIDSTRNIGCDNIEGNVIFGFKNSRYFDNEVQSIKNMDSKLKQTNERRAGRPPLDRSDYFCQICSATKTPQWRYISVSSVESKLRVCNACWMKQRKKRDGKCMPMQLGMNSGLNCPNIGGLLKTTKSGLNKENYDPQRQSYTREIGGMGYKISGISKNSMEKDRNTPIINTGANKDCKIASCEVTDNFNGYVPSEGFKNDKLGCNANNGAITGGSQCVKPISFRSSPYLVNTGTCSNSIFDCKICGGSDRCYCSSLIIPQSISLASMIANNATENSGNLISSSNEGIHYNLNNVSPNKILSVEVSDQNDATGTSYRSGSSSSLGLNNQCIQNVCVGDQIAEAHVDEGNNFGNFPTIEKPIFDINCAIETMENNVNAGIEESYVENCQNVNISISIEESPIHSIHQSPKQNSCADSYPGMISCKLNSGLVTRKCSDNRSNLTSNNKLSVSTPVHHQASTTVSPNTNYCNISSYTSSPCQSFSTYDGPFLEDPNKTMYISSGVYFYSSSETNRWNEDTPVQSSIDLNSCIGNSNNTEDGDKAEVLPFPLDQDAHSSALSQSNEQIENEQTNYSIFNKHLAATEPWNSDYLHIDMFCITSTEKTTVSSEAPDSVPHYSVGPKFFNASVPCTTPAVYPVEVQQGDESSSQNGCNSWDFDSSSISCIDTWQNPLWYDSYSNGYCKLS